MVTLISVMDEKNQQERPKRIRNPPKMFTPSKNSNVRTTNYNVNKRKAIEKKIDATTRATDVDIKLKSGTLVLTFTAAAYEVFRKATTAYFDNHKED